MEISRRWPSANPIRSQEYAAIIDRVGRVIIIFAHWPLDLFRIDQWSIAEWVEIDQQSQDGFISIDTREAWMIRGMRERGRERTVDEQIWKDKTIVDEQRCVFSSLDPQTNRDNKQRKGRNGIFVLQLKNVLSIGLVELSSDRSDPCDDANQKCQDE